MTTPQRRPRPAPPLAVGPRADQEQAAMFVTGIWRPEGLRGDDRALARSVSYGLLKHADSRAGGDIEVFERVIRRTRLAGGIYRTTYRGRMADLDAVVVGILRDRHGAGAALEVHDWATSDGLAALEWAGPLRAAFPNARVTASDRDFYLLEVTRGPEAFVLEEGGTPLQYVRPPFVIELAGRPSRFYVVNRWLLRRARRRAAGAVAAAARAHWDDLDDRTPREVAPWRVERIPLIHPEASRAAREGAGFRLERHSVFETLRAPVAAIRTMNILNRQYFPPERLRAAIGAVFGSLLEGGVWIVGRTAEEVSPPANRATVWEKAGGRFRELDRVGTGTEIADLVHDFHHESTPARIA